MTGLQLRQTGLRLDPISRGVQPFTQIARQRAGKRAAARRAAQPASAEQKAAKKSSNGDALNAYRPPSREGAMLRAEAEAPFRSFRLVIFGAGTAGATLATLFGLPSLIGALAGAPGATKTALEALQDLAINLGSVGLCGALVWRDLQAQEKQMARLMREEELGACQLELANKRVLRLAQLRGFARVVLVAGSPQQVAAALAAAEPFKERLQERGVLVVPVPFAASSGGGGGEGEAAELPPLQAEDLRWRATAIRLGDWRSWFEQQARLANKGLDEGLYISLRMDGRVRGSGRGSPPWPVMAAQLPPTEGFFGGFFDGMDGRVGG